MSTTAENIDASGNIAPDVKLTVVVCTFNRADFLAETLRSLASQTLAEAQLEVLVVDNNSTDKTQEVVNAFRKKIVSLRSLHESRQGLSYARNRGWQEARGLLVSYIDDDARAEPDWCERIVEAFEIVTPPPVCVGGPINPFYQTTPPPWFRDGFELRSWGNEPRFLNEGWEQFGFSGSNMTFPRKVLEALGGFRPELGMCGTKIRLGEEADFFYRLYQVAPRFWYDPAIRVRHWVPENHMRMTYQLKRSYRAGQARAMIQSSPVFSIQYVHEIRGLSGIFKELMLGSFPFGRDTKADFVRKMCRAFNQIGFLIGPRK